MNCLMMLGSSSGGSSSHSKAMFQCSKQRQQQLHWLLVLVISVVFMPQNIHTIPLKSGKPAAAATSSSSTSHKLTSSSSSSAGASQAQPAVDCTHQSIAELIKTSPVIVKALGAHIFGADDVDILSAFTGGTTDSSNSATDAGKSATLPADMSILITLTPETIYKGASLLKLSTDSSGMPRAGSWSSSSSTPTSEAAYQYEGQLNATLQPVACFDSNILKILPTELIAFGKLLTVEQQQQQQAAQRLQPQLDQRQQQQHQASDDEPTDTLHLHMPDSSQQQKDILQISINGLHRWSPQFEHHIWKHLGWDDWSDFTVCSRACGHGVQQRFRRCLLDDPMVNLNMNMQLNMLLEREEAEEDADEEADFGMAEPKDDGYESVVENRVDGQMTTTTTKANKLQREADEAGVGAVGASSDIDEHDDNDNDNADNDIELRQLPAAIRLREQQNENVMAEGGEAAEEYVEDNVVPHQQQQQQHKEMLHKLSKTNARLTEATYVNATGAAANAIEVTEVARQSSSSTSTMPATVIDVNALQQQLQQQLQHDVAKEAEHRRQQSSAKTNRHNERTGSAAASGAKKMAIKAGATKEGRKAQDVTLDGDTMAHDDRNDEDADGNDDDVDVNEPAADVMRVFVDKSSAPELQEQHQAQAKPTKHKEKHNQNNTKTTAKKQQNQSQQPKKKKKHHQAKSFSTMFCEGYNIEQRNCNTFECNDDINDLLKFYKKFPNALDEVVGQQHDSVAAVTSEPVAVVMGQSMPAMSVTAGGGAAAAAVAATTDMSQHQHHQQQQATLASNDDDDDDDDAVASHVAFIAASQQQQQLQLTSSTPANMGFVHGWRNTLNFTIMTTLRVKNDTKLSSATIFSIRNATHNLYLEACNAGLRLYLERDNTTEMLPVKFNLYDNRWHQVAISIQNGDFISIFIDCSWTNSYVVSKRLFALPLDTDVEIGRGFNGELQQLLILPGNQERLQCSNKRISINEVKRYIIDTFIDDYSN